MSRIYDNWEKLVGAVMRREKDRQLALRQSFSSLSSTDVSSRPSFASDVPADPADPSSHGIFVSHNIMAIQFEEIKLATQNFQPDMLLGEGRFGPVFKGWIHEHCLTAVKPGSGTAVAVKKHKEGLPGHTQREINYLTRPRHPNLVKLIGYGFEEDNTVLVYEFMPNGSLDNHLFTRGPLSLSWEIRIKVAIGAARGLSFFHDLGIMVTHEGVKSSSILLDDEFNANLSDFDLARAAPGLINISPLVRNDYVAPEYMTTGSLTMKSDVFSFGIILLELLSGLRVLDHNRPMKEQNLVVWMRPYLSNKRKLLQIVDSRLEGQYPHNGAHKVGKLASQCLSLDPKLRPRMSEVVDALEQLQCLNTEVKLSSPLSVGPPYLQNPREPLSPTVSTNPGRKFHPVYLLSQSIFYSRNVMALEFEEIKKATQNFQPDMKLGEGGLGPVFKGWVHEHNLTAMKPGSGIPVAVKNLNNEGFHGHSEWLAEINYLSQLRHPNLVKLIGYCSDTNNKILVDEFMPRGSLDNHLFTRGHKPLPWATRIKVAVGASRALAFLHDLEIPVIHRGFHSGDILLDGDFNTKLSDFGHAIDGLTGDMAFSTVVMGTCGYAAPEYVATGRVSTKCDVYGFGVVLLELISGLRVIDTNRPTGKRNLMDWAKPYLGDTKRLSQIMDSRLEGQYPRNEAYKVADIALQCLCSDPRLRPRMAEVAAVLERL